MRLISAKRYKEGRYLVHIFHDACHDRDITFLAETVFRTTGLPPLNLLNPKSSDYFYSCFAKETYVPFLHFFLLVSAKMFFWFLQKRFWFTQKWFFGFSKNGFLVYPKMVFWFIQKWFLGLSKNVFLVYPKMVFWFIQKCFFGLFKNGFLVSPKSVCSFIQKWFFGSSKNCFSVSQNGFSVSQKYFFGFSKNVFLVTYSASYMRIPV